MSAEAKDSEAAKLIDEFAEKLLALTDGKKIPTTWNIRLKAAISKTRPQRRGTKINPAEVEKATELIALNFEELTRPPSKNHTPSKCKDAIAKEAGISRKKFDRIYTGFVAMSWDFHTPASMTEDKRKAIVAGICNALNAKIDRAYDEEHSARVKKVQAI